ncbi:MAG: SDR family NAD(P)-dependent oxidoreductase [Dehalococcoidia bacterium]
MPDLAGHRAFVTGAGSGIGRAIALRLAEDGATVMCADLDRGRAEEVAARIADLGGRAEALALDVADEAAVRDALARTAEALGGLDLIVNNAGVGGGHGWARTTAVNLDGVYFGLAHGARLLAERGGGAIVNTSSIAGLQGLVGVAPTDAIPDPESGVGAYVAAKHGVVGLTKQFALMFAKHGLRVNAVCPGYVDTPLIEGITSNEQGRRFLESLHPMGRLGRPEEIAAAVAFLASDDAAFITGVALPVDGGYSAR